MQEDASIIQVQAQPQVLSHVSVRPGTDTGDMEGKELTASGWHSSKQPGPELKLKTEAAECPH